MMVIRYFREVLFLFTFSCLSLMFCNPAPNSSHPSNTSITAFVQTSDGKIFKESLWDTVGKPLHIGAALFLPQNIDSVHLSVTRENQSVFDTLFIDFNRDFFKDTILRPFTFALPGNYRATFTPKTALSLDPVSISFVMLASKNRKPELEITGNTIVKPGETCALAVTYSDPDSGQILTPSVKGQPEGSTFLNGTFFWSVPLNFTGNDTLVFSVTDNGDPPLSTEKQIILVVNAVAVNEAPEWNEDTLAVTFSDTSTYALNLGSKCTDPDGDSLTYLLLPKAPVNDSIKNGVYSFKATPASAGTHFPVIVVVDPHGASDTLVIKMTVQQSLSSAVELAAISFSSGTLREKAAPVPDTLYDTVSFNDSLISISLTLWNSSTTISINDNKLPDDSTATSIHVVPGTNIIRLTLHTADNSTNKTYILIIIRKQNSVEPLTLPPGGLTIDSVFATRVTLRWNDIAKATSYSVERSKQSANAFTLAGTINSNTYTDTGLEQGTVYFYRVNASNAAGSTGFSSAVSCTTLVKPSIVTQPNDTTAVIGKPFALTCSVSGTSVQIQWRKNGIDLTGKTSSTLSFSSIVAADTGIYTVKVWNRADSVVSQSFSLGVLPATPDGVVAIARSAFSTGISWNSAEAASRYILVRSASAGGISAPVCTTSSRTYVDTLLSEGATYRYRVIAVNRFGQSDTSAFSEVKTWEGPKITKDLESSLIVAEGQPVKLSVTATGSPECSYQWKKNDVEIQGATLNEYVIDPAYQSNSGIYVVVVKNGVRTINSKQIKVDVLPVYTLSTTSTPAAGGSISRSKDTAVYVSGSTVTLTAVPKTGYRFGGWSGDTTGVANPVVITVNKNKVISANFVRQYTLTLMSSSTTRGTVEPLTAVAVDSGVAFTIKATPNTNYKFSKWSTSSSGVVFGNPMSATTTVKLNGGNATIQAVFTFPTFSKQLQLNQYTDVTLTDAVQTEDGGYLVVGHSGYNEGLLIKLLANGDTAWTKKITSCIFASIYKGATGYVTAGTINSESYNGINVVCYSQSGTELWYFINRYEPDHYFSKVIAKPTKDNGYAICANNYPNINFIKIDASRNIIFDKVVQNENSQYGLGDFEQLSTGYMIVGDRSQNFSNFMIKTDNSGVTQWQFSLGKQFPDDICKGFTSVCVDVDGSCMFSGSRASMTTGEVKQFLAKMSPNDTNQITFSYYDKASLIKSVEAVADGFLFCGTTRILGNGEEDIYIVKTSKSGAIIYESAYGSRDSDVPYSLKLTDDGGCIVVGTNNWVIKTDENGKVE